MRLRSHKYSAHHLLDALKFPWFRRLSAYVTIWFIICLGDSIMTYFSPVYIENRVNSPLLMGLIIGSSSVIGLICDVFFGEWFSGKSFHFFLKWALIIFITFPLSYLILPDHPLLLMIPMALWGIAYELGLFSDFHFVNDALDHPHHAIGWSTMKTFYAAAYMIGPLIASYLLEQSVFYAPIASAALMGCGLIAYVILKKSLGSSRQTAVDRKHSIIHEFKVWRLLLPKLWPIIGFVFLATVLDATFWTVGAVFSESLKVLHPFGGFLLTIYVLPSLFAGFIGVHFSGLIGKKRTAFIGGAMAGLSFTIAGMVVGVTALLIALFIAAFFLGAAVPQMYAAIEDYIERLGQSANALVGLENSATSMAFIVGPIMAGAIATSIGYQLTFSIMGLMLFTFSVLALMIVPRKIHLPQQSLQLLDAPKT
jgi:MFS family permease